MLGDNEEELQNYQYYLHENSESFNKTKKMRNETFLEAHADENNYSSSGMSKHQQHQQQQQQQEVSSSSLNSREQYGDEDNLYVRGSWRSRIKSYLENRFGELTFKNLSLRGLRFLAVFLFSQVISCLLTSTGIFSTFLTNKFNINLPTLQNAISYTTLLAFYFPLLLVHKWCFPVVKKVKRINFAAIGARKSRKARKTSENSRLISESSESSLRQQEVSSPTESGIAASESMSSVGETALTTADVNTTTITSPKPLVTHTSFQKIEDEEEQEEEEGIKTCFQSIFKRLYIPERWNMKPWKYIFFAFADVEANFLVVKAYQYTTITSVMLLDCFTIPSVMLLSFLFLNRTYRWTHIVGVLICLTGLGLLVLSDYLRSISEEHHQTSENPWYYLLMGDAFCIVGSFCYAISNVAQEYALKSEDHFSQLMADPSSTDIEPTSPTSTTAPPEVSKPRLSDNDCAIEYLGMVGLFGTIIAIIQTLIFEREDIMNTKWTPQSMMYMAGFAASMFFIYTLVPHLIRWSSATFMNLSFLTSDIFAVIASVFLFGQSVYPLYYFAYAIIAIGLVFYNLLQEEERKSKSVWAKGKLLLVKCFRK